MRAALRRVPVQPQRQLRSKTAVFPAPKRGWIRNESLATPKGLGAEVLDNWFPTPEGCRMRKGSTKHATCDTAKAIGHLATYETGVVSKLFACDANSIYDATSPGDASTALTATVTGLASSAWGSTQFQAGGGIYLVMGNGTDTPRIYNGTLFGKMDASVTYSLAYDAETADFTVGATLTGGTSGATGTIVFDDDAGTTGTLYLENVSGAFQDNETITDGATGSATVNGTATSVYPAITGITTSKLDAPWAFKNRLFFIETGSLNAWYLPTLAIGGTASKVDLGGVFRYGGTLMFGATWSTDTGSGLDDNCIFVTENGEVAVYQGNDPSDATSWSLVGVYKIGKPLGKNAWFKAGGDIAIATDDGIVSVAQAIQKDRAGLVPITYPIEEAWREMISERAHSGYPFDVVLWQKESALVFAIPAFAGYDKYCFVSNSKTGAWSRYTGWDTRSVAVLADKLYFGTSTGLVVQGETGGSDQGEAYATVVIPRFEMLGSANAKAAILTRVVGRSNYPFSVQVFASSDYQYDIPAPLQADPDNTGDVWDSGIWGTAVWQGQNDSKRVTSEWQGTYSIGHALAPGLQIASGRNQEPDFELIALHVQYQVGGAVV